jgi:SAM-dependent methyltransferase
MHTNTVSALLQLNRRFYAAVSEPFDATRQGWTPGLLAILPYFEGGTKDAPVTVADVGCGNGRFARLLEERGLWCDYLGVDGEAGLLAAGQEATAHHRFAATRFAQADLADPGWVDCLPGQPVDRLLCTATLQHLPSYALRLATLQRFRQGCRGIILLSFWQFLSSERFVQKQIPWAQVGLSPADVEAGDALLPWRQGVEAVRYVHQVDEAEARQLAQDAGLVVKETFRADGKEGDLNLYVVLASG